MFNVSIKSHVLQDLKNPLKFIESKGLGLLVHFTQMTTVRTGGLTAQAVSILDNQQFGLFFNYNMLGYALMALSTFFAGLTICVKSKIDKWLKVLLLIHGVFFIACLILPMLGLFTPDMTGAEWIGTAILEFWHIFYSNQCIIIFAFFKSGELRWHYE